MPIVGGLDIHRKQLTFDYLDTVTGEVKRGQIAPADREAGKTHARASAPDHRYYAAVKDGKDGKRAALSEARKILRQACHILTELGDDAPAAA